MARGRMITNEIARDKRINDLSDDTSRLAFTWLVTFADSEGRTYGDPALLRSMLFPRRTDITVERMEGIVNEWHRSGLVVCYEAQGDKFIYFPRFEKHQVGLRKDREAPSAIPAPPGGSVGETPDAPTPPSAPTPDLLQSNDGVAPEEIGLIKENLIKVKDHAASGAPEPDKPPREEVNRLRDDLLKKFLIVTGHAAPRIDKPHIKAIQRLWWSPLEDMLRAGGWLYDRTEEAVVLAVKRMAADSLTISDPNSILKTVLSVLAEKNRNGNEHRYSEVY